MFQKIIVQPLDSTKIELKFIFKETSSALRAFEDFYCILAKMVDPGHRYAENVLTPILAIKTETYLTSEPISEDVLRLKYHQNNVSMREIASQHSCSKTKIRSMLLQYKIPIKSKISHYNSSSRSFGKKRVDGITVNHKHEIKTINTIKKMHSEDLNPSVIARLLNSMKVPTKRQGKQWHHATVIKILKTEGLYDLATKEQTNE